MRLLFVEDDEAIAGSLMYTLEKEGYDAVWCPNKKQALDSLQENHFDLLLLDVGLPDGNGFEICEAAKQMEDIPVIFLTAMDEEVNVVRGLDLGGDDYITKPFRINELLSRIKSVLRRYHQEAGSRDIVHIRDIDVHILSGKVYKKGQEVFLTALEYRLFLVFMNHIGQVLSRGQLLEGIWDSAFSFVNDNTLSVYIKRLREKLEDDVQNPTLIVTVRGLGYRLEKSNVKK